MTSFYTPEEQYEMKYAHAAVTLKLWKRLGQIDEEDAVVIYRIIGQLWGDYRRAYGAPVDGLHIRNPDVVDGDIVLTFDGIDVVFTLPRTLT